MLNEINYSTSLGLPVWNPQANPRDRYGVMPIITPAYPAMNSTHNISTCTQRVLIDEFTRGRDILTKLDTLKTDQDSGAIWKELFVDSEFFFKHKDYLVVSTHALTEDDEHSWVGYVESKLRQLIMKLAITPFVSCRPYPYSFRTPTPDSPFSDSFFFGLDFNVTESKQVRSSTNSFYTVVFSSFHAFVFVRVYVSSVDKYLIRVAVLSSIIPPVFYCSSCFLFFIVLEFNCLSFFTTMRCNANHIIL